MKPFDAALEKMRAICLALPDTKETPTWGQPHFRVGEKIFSRLGEEKGVLTVGAKLEMDHADAMVSRPGFSRAPYVGHKGWVSIDVGRVKDWGEIEALVHESYRLIAPNKTYARWQAERAGEAAREAAKKPGRRSRERRVRATALPAAPSPGAARSARRCTAR